MTEQRPWTRPERVTIKRREHSNATIDGHYVQVEIDEWSSRWYVSGHMFGVRCGLSGELPAGATLADLRAKAADVLRIAREGGLLP